MNKFKMSAAMAAGCLFLAGCAGFNSKVNSEAGNAATEETSEQLVNRTILESSKKIQKSLQFIEKVERGSSSPAPGSALVEEATVKPVQGAPVLVEKAQKNADEVLASNVSMNWENGSAEELLRAMSKQYGFDFKASGNKKALTNITVKGNMSVRGAFETIGRQIDAGADVVLVKTSTPAVVVLKYKN